MKPGKPLNLEEPAPETSNAEAGNVMDKPVVQRRSEVRLGREVQARIGQQLRSMYDEVVKEGVPQHIGDLVRRLSEQDDGAR
jgi:aromatic ring-cleaving dioxygenase